MRYFYTILFTLFIFCSGCTGNIIANDQHSHHHNGHSHHHTPHAGIVEPFLNAQKNHGYIELKLHDDKGDLELWITEDGDHHPIDLPTSSIINVTFPELDNKTVELRVRDKQKNTDENGKGNIRNKKTNYFIFPGDTGVSAEFLVGKDFSSDVIVSFSDDEKNYTTKPFTLEPH